MVGTGRRRRRAPAGPYAEGHVGVPTGRGRGRRRLRRTRCEAVREPAAPLPARLGDLTGDVRSGVARVVFGVAGGWTTGEFQVYWALGAVLNVPFLAGGELMLLVRNRTVQSAIWIVLVFVTAYTVSVLRGGTFDACRAGRICHRASMSSATGRRPTGCRSWFRSPPTSCCSAALWSAWRMRGRRELRDRSSARC